MADNLTMAIAVTVAAAMVKARLASITSAATAEHDGEPAALSEGPGHAHP